MIQPSKPPDPPPAKSRAVPHLADYFAILREHLRVALIPFTLILTASVVLTLLATPVYRTNALIEIETRSTGNGLIDELNLMDTVPQVESEMEIMRSRRVALQAAEMLLGDPAEDPENRGLSDFLSEVDQYRPLEVMLRAFRKSQPGPRVELTAAPLAEARAPESYRLVFTAALGDGRFTLDVAKIIKKRFRTERQSELVDMRSGEPFQVFGRSFTLRIEGSPVGHEYGVSIHSVESLAGWLRSSITVSQVRRNTGLVALGVRAETPRLAQAAARALALSFVETKRKKKIDQAGRTVTFLERQVASTEEKLRAVEQRLDEFRSRNGVTLLSERARTLIDRISDLRRQKVELEVQQEEQGRLVEELEAGGIEAGRMVLLTGEEDPTAAALAQQLARLEIERSALSSELTPLHPEVRGVEARIAAARQRLAEHSLLRAQTAASQAERGMVRVDGLLERLEAQERELPEKERQLANLTREVTSLLSIYNFLLEKKHEAMIARESTFSHVQIVDDPPLPSTRTSPSLLMNVLMGFFLAVLAALATAFFAEYIDRSIKTPEEVEEALGLPLYAALPSFSSIKSRDLKQLKSQMVTIERPHSILAEGYRTLRANIRFAEFESPVRTFAITSAVLGEGKTTTALNLAVVLAQAGSKVVVVDADMRRPATHHHLGGEASPGLTDILTAGQDWRSVIRDVAGVENLHVIHAGKKPDNPGALVDSPRFTKLLAELREAFDYVVFDVPPVLAVSDAASFFREIDAVFLLVQWRRCPIDVVVAARDQATRLGAKLRGVIFNGFDARKVRRRGYGRYGYYGYYGYYGRYRNYGYGYGYHGESRRKSSKKKASRI